MTDQNRSDESDLVERLVRLADAGPAIPAGGAESVKSALRPLWQREAKTRRIMITTSWMAGAVATAAAVALLLFTLPLGRRPAPAPVAPAGWFDLVRGTVAITPPHSDSTEVFETEIDRAIEPGAILRTDGDGRASVRLVSGATLRIDTDSTLRLIGADVVELRRGGIYVDSGADTRAIEVRTPLGVARDIGTQFEVRTNEDLVVRVRQGAVSLRPRSGAELTVRSGTGISVSADGSYRTVPISAESEHWSWILQASPPMDIEGRSVAALLQWVSAETGLAVRYESGETERAARATLLHGSLGDLRPDQAAEAILPSAGLAAERQPGALVVRKIR